MAAGTRPHPGRTAATAAALMIGIALVTFVAVLATGMKQSNRGGDRGSGQRGGGWYLAGRASCRSVAAAGDSLDGVGGLSTTDVRSDLAKVAGSSRYLTESNGHDHEGVQLRLGRGLGRGLGEMGSTALVDTDFAEDKNLSVGETFSPRCRREEMPLRLVGIDKPPPLLPYARQRVGLEGHLRHALRRPRNQSRSRAAAATAPRSSRRSPISGREAPDPRGVDHSQDEDFTSS